MVVHNQWNGLLGWNTGMDYRTDIFHIFGGLIDSHWLQVPLENLQPIMKWQKYAVYHLFYLFNINYTLWLNFIFEAIQI